MTDRDRIERGREQRGYGQLQPRPWDRQRYQSENGGYPDEDRDRSYDHGYSRLGGASEGDYERYQGSSQRALDYGREDYGQRDYGQRDWERQRNRSGMGSPSEHAVRQGPSGQSGYGQHGPSGQRGRYVGRGPKGYKRSDERIREDVCDALMMHPDIDPSDIEVKVSDGEVTLTGTVQDREDKYTAEQIADAIAGVREVTNNVRIKRASGEQSSS